MSRKTFEQYVFPIMTPQHEVRYVVASYEMSDGCYYQYSTDLEYRTGSPMCRVAHDPTELLSYPTRQQALRHARYLYGAGGQQSAFYRESTTS